MSHPTPPAAPRLAPFPGQGEGRGGDRSLTRRNFLITGTLAGGGLLVGCTAPPPESRLGTGAQFNPQGAQVGLNGWVKITPDGVVSVAVPRAEMGQGVHTALAMLVADELDADWSKVVAETAPVARIYANPALMLNIVPFLSDDDGLVARIGRASVQRVGYWLSLQVTGGSSSVRDAWGPMRLAGASARAMLVQAAASQWGVAPGTCTVANGLVSHAASQRQATFGALAQAASALTPPTDVALKAPKDFKLIGTPVPRLDIPAKPGVAFSLVKKLLAFNTEAAQSVEVVILSRNDPVSGLRVMKSAAHYALPIIRCSFTRGEARNACGSFDMLVAISALSAAILASNGMRPLAMAATRPKCVAMTVKAALRYLIASSGFANCAAAGSAVANAATAAAVINIDGRIRVMQFLLACLAWAAQCAGHCRAKNARRIGCAECTHTAARAFPGLGNILMGCRATLRAVILSDRMQCPSRQGDEVS